MVLILATAKALATSALPGMTRTLSTRLKLSEVPLIYSYDSPGVMLPFLGRGEKGAERGVKLALIGEKNINHTAPPAHLKCLAGVKEGMYDVETLAAYLLYRLNLSNPIGEGRLLCSMHVQQLSRIVCYSAGLSSHPTKRDTSNR